MGCFVENSDGKFEGIFCSSSEWDRIRENHDFDYIVVGTGPCALGFVNKTFKNKTNAKILMLERGNHTSFLHEDSSTFHEVYPWQLSETTAESQYIKYNHGMIPELGGRSKEWLGWCPRPTREQLVGWPKQVLDVCYKYFEFAENLLGVESVGGDERKPIFDQLQNHLHDIISENLEKIPTIYKVIHAPLAYEDRCSYRTFSTVGRLLELTQTKNGSCDEGQLIILLQCVVQNINNEKEQAVSLNTSRGTLPLRKSKLILAMGAIPPTTLLANSFPNLPNVGRFFGAHFVSKILARVPLSEVASLTKFDNDFEFAALFISGNDQNDMKKQFHIQLSAFRDDSTVIDKTKAEYAPTKAFAKLIHNGKLKGGAYVIFRLSALGELDVDNPNNRMKKIKAIADKTANLELNLSLKDSDLHLWDTMDSTMFDILENIISRSGSSAVEYWHESSTQGHWCKDRPKVEDFRHPGTLHECSTLMIGDEIEDSRSSVGFDYRPHTIENVYVTGGALFPRAGSWNPTLTMTALSIHLADLLNQSMR